MSIASVAFMKNYPLIIAIVSYPYMYFTLMSLVSKLQTQIDQAQNIVTDIMEII